MIFTDCAQQHAQMSEQPPSRWMSAPSPGRSPPRPRLFDRAVQYLLDADASPDRDPAEIYLLGVYHPGHTGSGPQHRSLFRRSDDVAHGWPPSFYRHFVAIVNLTYRSGFSPLSPHSISSDSSSSDPLDDDGSTVPPPSNMLLRLRDSINRASHLHLPHPALTSDAGWGCMLRTGQSLLANALTTVHLGRLPSRAHLSSTAYPAYARILSWFFDDPSPLCPFSVHRFALKGQELDKQIGEWFGPSTAAGAIKSFANAFPPAHLGVVTSHDGTLYRSEVIEASRASSSSPPFSRPVLILLPSRLGLSGVNPVYFPSIKAIFTFPQSVGIAGGRPSSSYYFVGCQGDGVFYIDPHQTKPAVSLHPPPHHLVKPLQTRPVRTDPQLVSSPSPNSSENDRSSALTVPLVDEPASYNLPPTIRPKSSSSFLRPRRKSKSVREFSRESASFDGSTNSATMNGTGNSKSSSSPSKESISSGRTASSQILDPIDAYFISSYPTNHFDTFHCEKVRKMSITGLDPSMLIGFVCRDEEEWRDLCERLDVLAKDHMPIVHIADEVPRWLRSQTSDIRTNANEEGAEDSLEFDSIAPGHDSFASDPGVESLEESEGESMDEDKNGNDGSSAFMEVENGVVEKSTVEGGDGDGVLVDENDTDDDGSFVVEDSHKSEVAGDQKEEFTTNDVSEKQRLAAPDSPSPSTSLKKLEHLQLVDQDISSSATLDSASCAPNTTTISSSNPTSLYPTHSSHSTPINYEKERPESLSDPGVHSSMAVPWPKMSSAVPEGEHFSSTDLVDVVVRRTQSRDKKAVSNENPVSADDRLAASSSPYIQIDDADSSPLEAPLPISPNCNRSSNNGATKEVSEEDGSPRNEHELNDGRECVEDDWSQL